MGVPYIPVIGLVGTDLLRNREDMQVLPDPFDGARKTVVAKAYRPDVCLVHGLRADRAGNVDLGRANDDVLLAEASARVIISVEEIVERVERPAHGGFLPGILVHAVVEAPFGAHPAAFPGRYPMDREALAAYCAASRDAQAFAGYVRETVHEPRSHGEYLARHVPGAWRGGNAPPPDSAEVHLH